MSDIRAKNIRVVQDRDFPNLSSLVRHEPNGDHAVIGTFSTEHAKAVSELVDVSAQILEEYRKRLAGRGQPVSASSLLARLHAAHSKISGS